jgi:excisionase family DNA binding protein
MKEGLMSIEQVAQLLNVSKDTVRRRIKKGELVAEKHIGAYGEQWFLPENQFDTARMIQDVVPVTRSVSVSELQAVMQKALAETVTQAVQQETATIREETGKLMEEIKSLKEQLATVQSNTTEHYRLVDERLRQLMETKKEPPKQSLWSRLFGL